MKTLYSMLIAAASLVQASAITVSEINDAGQTRATGQDVSFGTANLDTISGALQLSASDVDFYKINITNGAGFSASTLSGTDPMLFLWSLDGQPVAFNDDYSSLQSFINPIVVNGYYWLGISRFNNGYGMHFSDSGFSGNNTAPGGSPYSIRLTGVSGGSSNVPDGGSTLALLGIATFAGGALHRRVRK